MGTFVAEELEYTTEERAREGTAAIMVRGRLGIELQSLNRCTAGSTSCHATSSSAELRGLKQEMTWPRGPAAPALFLPC